MENDLKRNDALERTFPDPWIRTYTGNSYYYLHPDVDEICIEDIAHALSNICRYTGHSEVFYSVAQHSVLVSYLVSTESLRFEALMHDASEAYVNDIASPLKSLLPEYKSLERIASGIVARKFGLHPEVADEIKIVDHRILVDEAIHLLGYTSQEEMFRDNWGTVLDPHGLDITEFWSPEKAEIEFLNRFNELYAQ